MRIDLKILDCNGNGKTVDLFPLVDRNVYEDLKISIWT